MDPKASAMAEILATTRATTHAGSPPARQLRKEKTKSRLGAEEHDPAVTHLKLEKSQDYHEAAHDGCITEPPKLVSVASFDVGEIAGVGAKSGGIGDSLTRLAQEGMAKLAQGAPAVSEQEQQLEVEIYIRCADILATRGTRSPSSTSNPDPEPQPSPEPSPSPDHTRTLTRSSSGRTRSCASS
jgi:hypothetical protein